MTHIVPTTESLARFAVSNEQIPDHVLSSAETAFVDTIGVTVAAARESTNQVLLKALAPIETGTVTLLTDGRTSSARQAALINGTAAHALDYDDVTDSTKAHPSSPLVATILAVGEETGASGLDLLGAYVTGFQVGCAVADGMDIAAHYEHGWHATGTIGVMGATAAACRLLHADVDATRSALGIAASMAAGSRANFGSMTKPLHVGLAADNAVLAARLAAAGFTAAPAQLESEMGFYSMYGEIDAPLHPRDDLVSPEHNGWFLAERGIGVKKYPCCFFVHRAVDAILELRQTAGITEDEASSIEVIVEPGCLRTLKHHRPRNGLQAKFSMEYVVAAAFYDNELTLQSFDDDRVLRPEVQQLLPRVSAIETTTPPVGPETAEPYAVVRLTAHDGRIFTNRVDTPRGHATAPLTEDELRRKFVNCIEFSATGLDAALLFDRIRNLRHRNTVSGLVWPT